MTKSTHPTELTGKQRSYLRALAHSLKPVVQVGHGGPTPPVLDAIDHALQTHELIKVRVTGNEELSVDELISAIEQRTRAAVAQVIGKTLVIYRARKKDPVIVLPAAASASKAPKTSKTAPRKAESK